MSDQAEVAADRELIERLRAPSRWDAHFYTGGFGTNRGCNLPFQAADRLEALSRPTPATGELAGEVERLIEAASEPKPDPLPEQDTRVGEAMAAQHDSRELSLWRARVSAAESKIVALVPTILAALRHTGPT